VLTADGAAVVAVVTASDRSRLWAMCRAQRSAVGDPFRAQFGELEGRLRRATVVPGEGVAPDVVTMNSRVAVRDVESGRAETFTLVYHGDSGVFDRRLSVLSPLGVRALGARVGDVIEWPLRRGVRRLRVERIEYQPEAAGDFDL
jgi:regulator of nucleoside diphosphate kinase